MVSSNDTLAAFSRITEKQWRIVQATEQNKKWVSLVRCCFRRRATPDFSPAFQGRDRKRKSNHVASATID